MIRRLCALFLAAACPFVWGLSPTHRNARAAARASSAIPGRILPQVAEIGRFVRERRAYTAGAAAVPQIALLYSAAATRSRS